MLILFFIVDFSIELSNNFIEDYKKIIDFIG